MSRTADIKLYLEDNMKYTEEEVMEFIEENNVKFIRLAFCDVYGVQKNISIMPTELQRAFEAGIPFDPREIAGFGDAEGELFLYPDPSTLMLLPWRPTQGRVIRFFCDIKYADGRRFELDNRYILRRAVARAREMGIGCDVGAECEFYLFRTDENGEPTDVPFDRAGYMDIAPADKGENIRREICLTLEEMGITPEDSHHEAGPGQNEIDFRYNDALRSADDILTFRMVVKILSARNGLYASFAPKPIPDECGNGFHIDLYPRSKDGDDDRVFRGFIAGICRYVREMTLFLNPCDQSYDRLESFKAPHYVTWAHDDRSHLIRIPPADGRMRRVEVRSPDSTANPYIATALLIHAGLCGVEEGLDPGEPLNVDLSSAPSEVTDKLIRLPETPVEAWELASRSDFIGKYMPASVLESYRSGTGSVPRD